ncbi:three-helix bundle dimerization domain-containing protein [Mycolicibacterium sp. CBMA 293]
MSDVVARLALRYPEHEPSAIADSVERARECFASSPIRDFLPLLVERRARTELATVLQG